MQRIYTRLRNTLPTAEGGSPPAATFLPAAAVFLAVAAAVGPWLLATVVFLAVAEAGVAAPVRFVAVPARVDLTIVVPEEILDDVVLVLVVRSC